MFDTLLNYLDYLSLIVCGVVFIRRGILGKLTPLDTKTSKHPRFIYIVLGVLLIVLSIYS